MNSGLPRLQAQQEATIAAFESSVDTNAFEAMVETYKASDTASVTFDRLEMETEDLPEEMRESHYFPRRFTLTAFDASVNRFNTTDADDGWALTASYKVNDNPYRLHADSEGTVIRTSNYEGADLTFKLPAGTTGRLLTTIVATQMDIPKENLPEYFDSRSDVSAEPLTNLLKLVGNYNPSAKYARERLVWLPLLNEYRSLVIKYEEAESSVESGRRLGYRMAWHVHDAMKTGLFAFQKDFSLHAGQEHYFSQRTSIDFDPGQLLFMQQLGVFEAVEEDIDPAIDRAAYAQVCASMKFVLDRYLKGFASLDRRVIPLDIAEHERGYLPPHLA